MSLEAWRTYWQHALQTATSRGLLIVGLVIGYVLVRVIFNRLIEGAISRLISRQRWVVHDEERASRLRTLQGLSRSIANYALLFVLIVMLLDAIGANVYGVLTTAGIGGIAVGLGAQKLVKDVISGFFLIIEDQFVVGDYVTIGAATGVVEELGMRITRIRDDSSRLWILSNGDISTVTNHSRTDTSFPIDVSIAAPSDAEAARKVIQEACTSLFNEQPGALRSAPKVEGIAGWDTARVLIRVNISAAPNAIGAEQIRLRQNIYTALISNGIDIA